MRLRIPAAMACAVFVTACQQMPPDTYAQTLWDFPRSAEFDRQMVQIQDMTARMDDIMAQLQQTQDPQSRQSLLREHWMLMQNARVMMQGMWQPGMVGGPLGNAGAMMSGGSGTAGVAMGGGMPVTEQDIQGYYSRMPPEQLKERQIMNDRYIVMQQRIMNHMQLSQDWQNQAASTQPQQ